MAGFGKVRTIDGAMVGLAVALAVLLNWDSFVRAPLAIDEHVSFWISDGSSPSTLLDRSFQYSATPPLFFAIERVCMALFGRSPWSEWVIRLPAACSFLGAVIATWWLGRTRMSPIAGGI